MYQCQDASGDVPNYGNNDGALVFKVTSCTYRDFDPVINTVHALTAGTQLYGAGKHQEELIWFSGGKALRDFAVKPLERRSSQFADAGLFTLRNGSGWAMLVANAYRSRPAHMDQLHLDLWAEGVNVLCDAGTYSYASELGRQLVKNESHNTAVVPGALQMNASGPFLIYDWTERALGACNDNTFEGTIKSKNGYAHSRRVAQSGASLEITDSVDRDFTICFHTVCKVTLTGNQAALSYNGKELCRISSSGEMTLRRERRSLYYLRHTDVSCLRVAGQKGTTIKTLIEF